ncbi:MAG: hypothetical protein AOA66_1405 [Candidatus Bathyarchaeota archaeon BA2]|nr:MAG: hypothetical protein AOA66_1405 [Candidatus Bathyarchaeota archaeon BA2]
MEKSLGQKNRKKSQYQRAHPPFTLHHLYAIYGCMQETIISLERIIKEEGKKQKLKMNDLSARWRAPRLIRNMCNGKSFSPRSQ